MIDWRIFRKRKARWMGVILCGGKSSRSGNDKGLQICNDKSCAETSKMILDDFVEETIFSVNEIQFLNYKKKFQDSEIIIDTYQLGGPISGILSAFSAYRIFNFIALPCDMVNMKKVMIETLLAEYKKYPRHDFYVFKSDSKILPFCGIYTSKGMKKIYETYNEGIDLPPIESILRAGDTKYIYIEQQLIENFETINASK